MLINKLFSAQTETITGIEYIIKKPANHAGFAIN